MVQYVTARNKTLLQQPAQPPEVWIPTLGSVRAAARRIALKLPRAIRVGPNAFKKITGAAVVNQKTVDNCESFGAVRQAAASSTTKKSKIQGAYRVRVKGELSQDLAGAHSVLPKLSHRLVKG